MGLTIPDELEWGDFAPPMSERLSDFDDIEIAAWSTDVANATTQLLEDGILTQDQATMIIRWITTQVARRI